MPSRRELIAEVAGDESRIAERNVEAETIAARLAVLRKQLEAAPRMPGAKPKSAPATAQATTTNTAKVTLFRSLFRSREDVFPRSLENVEEGHARPLTRLRQRMGIRAV